MPAFSVLTSILIEICVIIHFTVPKCWLLQLLVEQQNPGIWFDLPKICHETLQGPMLRNIHHIQTKLDYEAWDLTVNLLHDELTHCGLMTPYGDRDLGQHLLR